MNAMTAEPRPVYDDTHTDTEACRRMWCARILDVVNIASPAPTIVGRVYQTPYCRQADREWALRWLRGRDCRDILDMLGICSEAFREDIAAWVPDIEALKAMRASGPKKKRGSK